MLFLSAVTLLSMNVLQRERNPEGPDDRAHLVGHDPAVLVGSRLPDYAAAVPGTRFITSASFLAREDCLVTGQVGTGVLPSADAPGRPQDSTLIMWPDGTKPLHVGDRIGVVLPDGTEVLAGEHFEGVGDRYPASVLRLPRGIPQSCGIEQILTLLAVGDDAHRVPDCPDLSATVPGGSSPPKVPGKVCVHPRPVD